MKAILIAPSPGTLGASTAALALADSLAADLLTGDRYGNFARANLTASYRSDPRDIELAVRLRKDRPTLIDGSGDLRSFYYAPENLVQHASHPDVHLLLMVSESTPKKWMQDFAKVAPPIASRVTLGYRGPEPHYPSTVNPGSMQPVPVLHQDTMLLLESNDCSPSSLLNTSGIGAGDRARLSTWVSTWTVFRTSFLNL